MADQHFFLHEKWLGTRKIETLVDHGLGIRPQNSYALFCPACAAIWGKMMHDHPQAFCQPVISRCVNHAVHWSDSTFTVSTNRPFAAREWSDDLPIAVKRWDIAALTNFWFNHPDQRWMTVRLS